MVDKVEVMNKIEKLDDKIAEERQKMYSLKGKAKKLKLKKESLFDEIENTRILTYAFTSLYYKRKIHAISEKLMEVKYELKQIESRLAKYEIKKLRLENDLVKLEFSFTTKAMHFIFRFVTRALFYMLISFLLPFYKPTLGGFLFFYLFL